MYIQRTSKELVDCHPRKSHLRTAEDLVLDPRAPGTPGWEPLD